MCLLGRKEFFTPTGTSVTSPWRGVVVSFSAKSVIWNTIRSSALGSLENKAS